MAEILQRGSNQRPAAGVYDLRVPLGKQQDHFDDVALIYFRRKVTYGELFENIDKTAAAFTALGVILLHLCF